MKAREVIVGVTGGIAAYKVATVVSQLVQSGTEVSVVMTSSAKRFVGEATFSALTGRAVFSEVFDGRNQPLGAHITLAQRADLLCIAPATADFLAKAACGLADDLLSTLYLSFGGPILLAPAMNGEMWAKPAVARNIDRLKADGVHLVGPEEGWLSCRQKGMGRMSEPDKIVAAIQKNLK